MSFKVRSTKLIDDGRSEDVQSRSHTDDSIRLDLHPVSCEVENSECEKRVYAKMSERTMRKRTTGANEFSSLTDLPFSKVRGSLATTTIFSLRSSLTIL